MGVEPNSFCSMVGNLAERGGETWASHFDRFDQLEHAVTDTGSGLLRGWRCRMSTANELNANRSRIPWTCSAPT